MKLQETSTESRKDFLLEETVSEFTVRFDIPHTFPPGKRPKKKRGVISRIWRKLTSGFRKPEMETSSEG